MNFKVGDIVRVKKCAFREDGSVRVGTIADKILSKEKRMGVITVSCGEHRCMVFTSGKLFDTDKSHTWIYHESELKLISHS